MAGTRTSTAPANHTRTPARLRLSTRLRRGRRLGVERGQASGSWRCPKLIPVLGNSALPIHVKSAIHFGRWMRCGSLFPRAPLRFLHVMLHHRLLKTLWGTEMPTDALYIELKIEPHHGLNCVYVHSEHVPGLFAVGKCFQSMKPMLEALIVRLMRDNRGINIGSFVWLQPTADKLESDVLKRLAVFAAPDAVAA